MNERLHFSQESKGGSNLVVTISGYDPIFDSVRWEWFRKRYLRTDNHPYWNSVDKSEYDPVKHKEVGWHQILITSMDTLKVVMHKEE